MGADPKRTKKPITKLLDAASLDLDAARRLLVDPPNVLAANHLQQAAEKLREVAPLLAENDDDDSAILADLDEPTPRPAKVAAAHAAAPSQPAVTKPISRVAPRWP